jgi:hypothetical protein
MLLKYNVNFSFSMVDPRIILSGTGLDSQRDPFRNSVERAKLDRALPLFLYSSRQRNTAHPLVQVDYVRVIDLDIGASKSGNLRD